MKVEIIKSGEYLGNQKFACVILVTQMNYIEKVNKIDVRGIWNNNNEITIYNVHSILMIWIKNFIKNMINIWFWITEKLFRDNKNSRYMTIFIK